MSTRATTSPGFDMAIPFRAGRTLQLTHAGLVLSRRKRPTTHLAIGVLSGIVVAGLLVGGFLLFAPESANVRELAEARSELRTLHKALEDSTLRSRMSEARANELERQVDGLNERIRALEDEVTFFRKAQEGRR